MILDKVRIRGLAKVLLLLNLFTIYKIPVKAETVDDLRAYLGKPVQKRDLTMKYEQQGNTTMNTQGEITGNEDALTIEELKLNLARLEGLYETEFKKNNKADVLMDILKVIRETKMKIADLEDTAKFEAKVDIDALIESSKLSQVEFQASGKFGSYWYDIGLIGDRAIVPVDRLFKLETPYGYKVYPDGRVDWNKHTGIELVAPINQEIKSVWNGKVAYIEDDEIAGLKVVTIYHGDRLYTVYHHIIPSEIYQGKPIKQGDVIGVAGDTSVEQDKNNHIKFQVILDGKYINPLLIFGYRGKSVYEDWLRQKYYTYTVEEGEEFYYIPSMSKENPNKERPGVNTVKGAAKLPDNYVRPDPGIVNIDFNKTK